MAYSNIPITRLFRIYALYGRGKIIVTVLGVYLLAELTLALWVWLTPGVHCKTVYSSCVSQGIKQKPLAIIIPGPSSVSNIPIFHSELSYLHRERERLIIVWHLACDAVSSAKLYVLQIIQRDTTFVDITSISIAIVFKQHLTNSCRRSMIQLPSV